ncbi:MAG: hypothetical protein MUW56_02915 [Chryseobacterium sp.]|uniref:hypothetical protein n=1 Tax=Chryseobacterium sp. TaxID=1871047 RepID=UPI0025BB0591|nr:hypothetical protein [Chryseobacterium sp.]MCJ7932597.1 hypothetical protein [Chryseobacterium sp.]
MKKILLIAFALITGFTQAQVKKKTQTTQKPKTEKKWVNPVKLTKEERNRPYMDEVLKTKDSLTPLEAERRRKNIAIGNPFAKYGVYPKIATLSRGKYLEFHDTDSIVIIGSIKYNTKRKNIIEVREVDLSDPDAQPIGDTHGRWMSPDPLSEEFPDWSPYNYAQSNPLRNIDPTGLAPEDIHILGNLAQKGFEQLQSNSSLAMTMDSNGKLNTANLSKSDYNNLSATDKVLYDGIKNTNIDSRIYADNNNVTPNGGLIPGGSFGGADYNSTTNTSTGTQYTNPEVLGNAESFTGTQKGTGMTHEVVENVLITQESLKTKSDVSISTSGNPNPVFNKFHDLTRSMMPYDNLVISARTRFETGGTNPRKYYEGFAGKKDSNGKIQTIPLYKVYTDDKKLKK